MVLSDIPEIAIVADDDDDANDDDGDVDCENVFEDVFEAEQRKESLNAY